MTLHDEFIALNDVFFDTEIGFAEEVTYVPRGIEANQFITNAVVDWSNEEGNNQVRGDGRASLNQGRGRSVRRSVVIELPTTRTLEDGSIVPFDVNEDGRDRVKVTEPGRSTTITLSVKRIISRDEAMQSVLCTVTAEFAAQSVRTGRLG